MSYQNGASNGSGYQPIESSMSNGGKFASRRTTSSRNPKMRVPEYLWEVQTPLMRIESLLMGGFCISPNLEPTDMLIHFIFYKSMLF